MKHKFIILLCLTALLAAFSGCSGGGEGLMYSDGTVISSVPLYGENEEAVIAGFEAVDEDEAEQVLSKCEDIAGSYARIYLKAEKEKDSSRTDDDRLYLSEEGYGEIFDFLSGSGIPLIKNSGDNYGALLDKSSFDAFWVKASEGEDAELPVFALGSRGDLYCYKFCCKNGEKYCLEAMVYWQDGELVRGSIQKYTLDFWLLTEKENFIYGKQYAPRWMGNGYGAIHIGPMDEALEACAVSYVNPVGYHGNGLFLCDWSEGDWGELNFNDLFEYLYRLKYGTYFQTSDYVLDADSGCYYLDEGLFEPVVQSCFDISTGDLRSMTLYDSARGAYPWQCTACNNYIYNGLMLPDVRSCTDNGDGTIAMEIDVICPELKTDCLFKHLLTVRPLPDGGFQYVSNEILYLDERTFPLYYPRIDDQRAEEYRGRTDN